MQRLTSEWRHNVTPGVSTPASKQAVIGWWWLRLPPIGWFWHTHLLWLGTRDAETTCDALCLLILFPSQGSFIQDEVLMFPDVFKRRPQKQTLSCFYSYIYTDQNQIMCVSLSASSALHKLDSVNLVIVAQEDTNNSNLSKIISIHKVFI